MEISNNGINLLSTVLLFFSASKALQVVIENIVS